MLPAAPAAIRASPPGCLQAPLACTLASRGGGRDLASTRPEATWGGVSRAAKDHRGAPRARLQPRAAAGHGPAVSWGLILGLARQLAGAIRGRRHAGDPTCQPMLNVALGITRRLELGPRLAGPLAGRPAWGPLGLGLPRLPCFARPDRSPRQAMGLRCAGPQSQKGADVLGLPVLFTCMGAPPPVLLLRNVWTRVPCIRSGPAMGIVLGRAGWPGGIMSNGVLGSGGNSLLLGMGGGRTRRPRTLGSRTSWSLGSRAPGAPGRDPDGCFAKAWTFLRVRGPPTRASAMALVAAWQAGAPVHRFVRKSQKRT